MALVKTKVPKSEHPKHGQNTHTHIYIYIHIYIYTYVYYIQYAIYSTYIVDFGWNRYDIFTNSTADFIPKQFEFGNIGSLCVLNISKQHH